MALSTAIRPFLGILIIFANYQCAISKSSSECEWTVEYTSFPNEINYHSTCNDDASLRITMLSLKEYTLVGLTPNVVWFQYQYASSWSWMDDAFGEESAFQDFRCKMNKYIGKLGSLLGGNCLFNLTTYLFEEYAQIDIYNLTQKWMDKYSFKWDMDLAEWPWVSSLDHLELCMDMQSTVGDQQHKYVNVSSGDMWVNVSFDIDFDVSFPKYFTCNGQINGDVKVDVSGETTSLVTVCIDIPYCGGAIYYDPIVSSNYKASTNSPLTVGEVAGIVVGCLLFLLCVGVCVFYCKYNRKKEPDYAGLLSMTSQTPTKK